MSHEHIKIYNKVPYNTGTSKLPDLEPWNDKWNVGEALASIFVPSLRRNDLMGLNTVQRLLQIPTGHISENYDDEPYIVPFLVPGSKKCIIVVPGGAYYDVSMDNEGYPTGEFFQKQGISTFVLKYRVYPYRYPAAQLDCRRALCYVKYHAKEFGIDPNQVSLLGFSAGGNLVVSTTYLFKELPEIEGYVPDEIDLINPTPRTLAPIYPETLGNKFLTSVQFGPKVYEDEKYADEIMKKMYLPQYIDKNSPPLFLMDCIDDGVVDPLNIIEMASSARKAKIQYEVHMFTEGGHGFGTRQENIPAMYGNPAFNMEGTKEWPRLYITWLNKIIK